MIILYEKLLNSHLFSILFNPRYEITKREYWAGLIVLFLLTLSIISFGLYHMLGYSLKNYDSQNAITVLISKNFLNAISPVLIPSASIIFYSSFILTFKRCKAIVLNSLKWIISIITFLMFSLPYASLQVLPFLNNPSINKEDSNIITSILNLSGIIILLGIISILLLSFTGKKEEKGKRENAYSQIGFTFTIFKFIAIVTAIVSIVSIILVATKSEELLLLNPSSYIIPSIICNIIFLFFVCKRAIDAGISALVPVLILVGLNLLSGISIYIVSEMLLANKPVLESIITTFGVFMYSVGNMLFFILLMLPSKKKFKIEKEEIEQMSY